MLAATKRVDNQRGSRTPRKGLRHMKSHTTLQCLTLDGITAAAAIKSQVLYAFPFAFGSQTSTKRFIANAHMLAERQSTSCTSA